MPHQVENRIEKLDNWMIQEVDLSKVNRLSDLGFKQLNDLIFYKHFPQFRENLDTIKTKGDDALMLRYASIIELPRLKDFDVAEYILLIEKHLKQLPTQLEVQSCQESYTKVLFQNLVIITFTLERWGQFVLRNKPGATVRSVTISESKVSLHKYLKDKLGNYNTIASFALTSTSETNGMYYPNFGNNSKVVGEKFLSQSSYSDYNFKHMQNISRFPSIMKLDSFMILIKKGEIVSYAYNNGLFDLMSKLKTHKLSDSVILQKVKEISYCFKISVASFFEFFKDPFFNESKFILILRQLTVELNVSPATTILSDIALSTHEKIRFKGFLDHYLVKNAMSSEERIVYVEQILKNEGVDSIKIKNLIRHYISSRLPAKKNEVINLLNAYTTTSDRELLLSLICELIDGDEIGIYRLKYSLSLFKKIAPRLEVFLIEKMSDESWLEKKLNKIRQLDYYLAPSGANSVAFYGPDVILGHAEHFPNYSIHMLNRLNVMIPDDQYRFWNLENYKTNNLFSLLHKHLTALPDIPKEVFSGEDSNSSDKITTVLINYPYLAPYVDLYESFAALASAHNASVERFIRRVGRKMDKVEKEKLVSSPDHGTTFMQPSSESELKQATYNLPSLDKMTEIRKNHIFVQWIKPLKALRELGKLTQKNDLNLSDYKRYFFQ
jgi:Ca2+-binding EF-hand superfamily protein